MTTTTNGLTGTSLRLPAASGWPAAAWSRRDVAAVSAQALGAELCLSARRESANSEPAGVKSAGIGTERFGIDALVHGSVLMTGTPMTRLDKQFGPADAIGRDPQYGYTPQRSGTRVWKPPV